MASRRRFRRSGGIVSGHSVHARVIIVVIRRVRPRLTIFVFSSFVSLSRISRVMDLSWLLFSARFPLRLPSAAEEPTEIRGDKSPCDSGTNPFRVNRRRWHRFHRSLTRPTNFGTYRASSFSSNLELEIDRLAPAPCLLVRITISNGRRKGNKLQFRILNP